MITHCCVMDTKWTFFFTIGTCVHDTYIRIYPTEFYQIPRQRNCILNANESLQKCTIKRRKTLEIRFVNKIN